VRTPAEVESAFAEFVEGTGPMLVDAIADRGVPAPISAWIEAAAHANIFSE